MTRKPLRNKETRELIDELSERYGSLGLDKNQNFVREDNVIKVDGEVLFFYYEGDVVPTVKMLLKENFLKKVTVDMGAVPFVVKGADIMRPGITEIEEGIKKGDYISIVDENYKKPLSVCISRYSSGDMKMMDKGKAVKNIHYVGDEIWDLS